MLHRIAIEQFITSVIKLAPKPSPQLLCVLGHFYMSPHHMSVWLGSEVIKNFDQISSQLGSSSSTSFLTYLENEFRVDAHTNRDSDHARASHEIMLRILEGRISQLGRDMEEAIELNKAIKLSLPEGSMIEFSEKLDPFLMKQYNMIRTSLIVSNNLIKLADIFGREDSAQQLREIQRRLQPERLLSREEESLSKKKHERDKPSPKMELHSRRQGPVLFPQSQSPADIWPSLSFLQQQAVLNFAREQGQYLFVYSKHLFHFFNEQHISYTCVLSGFSDRKARQFADEIIKGNGRPDMLMHCGLICVKQEEIMLEAVLDMGLIQRDDLASLTHVPETALMLMTQLTEKEPDEVADTLNDEYNQQTETKKLAEEALSNHINEIFMSYNDSLSFSPATFKENTNALINKIMQDTTIKEKIGKSDSTIISCVISNIEKFNLTDEQRTIIKNAFINAYQWTTMLKDTNFSASEIESFSLSF